MADRVAGTPPDRPRGSARWYRRLYVWVFAAMVAGAVTGLIAPDVGKQVKPLGDGFVELLTMLLGPIVFCMVVGGIASIVDLRRVGRVAVRSIVYFEAVTTCALVLGLVVVNLVRPGAGMEVAANSLMIGDEVAGKVEAGKDLHGWDYVLQLIPGNAVDSFAQGAILQILVLAVLFGVALSLLGPRAAPIVRGIDLLSDVLFTVVRLVTYAAPIGVFAAMAYTTGTYGAATVGSLLKLIATFYGTSLVFMVVVLGGILLLLRIHPVRTFRYFRDEILLALGSSSSEVAIPGIVRKLENLGISKGTAGMSVSAGYSFNLDGTCIYLTLSSMFIAQALGIHLTFGQQLVLLAVMLLSSKGTAGVTGGGFVMLATTLSSLSLIPVSGIMLVFGIDRFMSECRAVVNSFGNAVAGLAIGRWEKELDPVAARAIMAGERPGHVIARQDADGGSRPADPAAVPEATMHR
ncbi:cation:dicarboxylase symporter family transporter [Nonomuraea sp. NPDC005650]|uniref:cation:dicarboxylate symporter family transporter n=1 Tax=Nonomuraea sp. NPDC005650 TaxID=3157045 RepID=UPI0033B9921F